MEALTRGANFDANINWSGPVNMAVGIISPKIKSKVTLKMIVIHVGINLSTNRGRHSYASEFMTNNVIIKRWFWLTSGKIKAAASDSAGSSAARIFIRKSKGSNVRYPRNMADIIATRPTLKLAPPTLIR
mmetsp:Transcript_12514/g.26956  ORF Transcript_12514/g.26956 Transcript_12514/m.26956 type:complete len:130 (-) Transcript_12514:529-918(-)